MQDTTETHQGSRKPRGGRQLVNALRKILTRRDRPPNYRNEREAYRSIFSKPTLTKSKGERETERYFLVRAQASAWLRHAETRRALFDALRDGYEQEVHTYRERGGCGNE